MGQDNLARLQTGLVGNVTLGGEVQPDRCLGGIVVVAEEIFLAAFFRLLGGSLFDVREKGFGSLDGLVVRKYISYKYSRETERDMPISFCLEFYIPDQG